MEALAMMRVRAIHHCRVCGRTWKSRPFKSRETAEAARLPKCPNLACGTEATPIGMDLSKNRAPATIGANLRIKAVDETARIVMEDHGLGDLRSDQRMGDTAAPRLRPDLQKIADNMFAPPKARGARPLPRVTTANLARYHDPKTPDVMGAIHGARWRPPVHIINEPPPR
jgi:hypothetical protein